MVTENITWMDIAECLVESQSSNMEDLGSKEYWMYAVKKMYHGTKVSDVCMCI